MDAPGSSGAKICFLTLAEKGYPRRFAFDYLDDLQKEFLQLHGQQIDSVERPYKFITFGEHRPTTDVICGIVHARGIPSSIRTDTARQLCSDSNSESEHGPIKQSYGPSTLVGTAEVVS